MQLSWVIKQKLRRFWPSAAGKQTSKTQHKLLKCCRPLCSVTRSSTPPTQTRGLAECSMVVASAGFTSFTASGGHWPASADISQLELRMSGNELVLAVRKVHSQHSKRCAASAVLMKPNSFLQVSIKKAMQKTLSQVTLIQRPYLVQHVSKNVRSGCWTGCSVQFTILDANSDTGLLPIACVHYPSSPMAI
jgi:hypothetical protein